MNPKTRRGFLAAAGLAIPAGMLNGEAAAKAADKSPAPALPVGDPRDMPAKDARLEVRTLDTPCAAPRFASKAQWEKRSKRLREQILSAAGLWPAPARTPLNAQVFDRIEGEGFTVEKVYFEASPNFYCTGNLYRPKGGEHKPPYPGIICPHGHWNYGRLEHAPGDVNGGSIPARCMNFALQGYVSFAYDMVGYNDSFQIVHRDGEDEKAPWGMTPKIKHWWLWGISHLGLQLWNAIRALDFITALPDVDSSRIGATGASGGGTQTFLVTAVDERVKVSAPVNMISHFMQGGCICENAPNLRIDTNNMEIGALAAPRPLVMVSTTGDWTRDSERIEYPAIAGIYELLGARDHVAHRPFTYDHNYNRYSREAVYRFFGQWLPREPRKDAAHLEEREGFNFDPGHLLVFSRRPTPSGALDTQGLVDFLTKDRRDQLSKARPERPDQIAAYRQQFEAVYRTALMAETPPAEDLRWWHADGGVNAGKGHEKLTISRHSVSDRIPGLLVRPAGAVRGAVLIIHPEGAKAALGTVESPSPLARALSKQGMLVLSVDTFQTGEARDAARKAEGGFFVTYNRADDMQRVQDILTALAWLEASSKPARIAVVGQGKAGLWCLLARPLFSKDYAVAADVAGFDTSKDDSYLEKLYIPLIRRAGDFQSAALLAPATPLLIHNTAGRFASDAYKHAYELRNASARLRVSDSEVSALEIAAWMMKA
jgi:dienelactone hydrolase